MSKKEQYHNLKDLEFVIDKYYDQNIRALVEQKYQEIDKKRKAWDKKHNNILKGTANTKAVFNEGTGTFYFEEKEKNPWEKTSDDLLDYVYENINANDANNLSCFASAALNDKSPDGIKGQEYIVNRLQQCLVRQLAEKKDISSSSLEYIGKKGVSDSFIGLWWEGAKKSFVGENTLLEDGSLSGDINERVRQIEKEKGYNTFVNNILAESVASAIDTGITAGVGGAAFKISAVTLHSAVKFALAGSTDVAIRMLFQGRKVDTKQQEYAYALFHNKELLEAIEKKGRWVSGHNMTSIELVNSTLENKIDVYRYFIQRDEILANRNIIESESNSDKARILSSVSKGLDVWNLKVRKDSHYDWRHHDWMNSMSADQCRRTAAYYYSITLLACQKGIKYVTHNGKKYSVDELAQLAYDYAYVARNKYSTDKFKNIRIANKKDILKRSSNDPFRFHGILSQELNRKGIKSLDSHVPSWMMNLSSKRCLEMSAFYYGRLKGMDETGAKVLVVNQYRSMSRQEVAQMAWNYSKASTKKFKIEKQQTEYKSTRNHAGNKLLIKANNNSQQLNNLIKKELSGMKIKVNSEVPSWMNNISSGLCRQMASSYYGKLAAMRASGISNIIVKGGSRMSQQEVAQMAFSYSNASIRNEKKEKKTNKFRNKASYSSTEILRIAKGNNSRFYSLLSIELKKLGIKTNSSIPSWMNNVSSDVARRMSAHYYGRLASMRSTGTKVLVVKDGRRMSQQEVAQMAASYARAAVRNKNNEIKSAPVSRAKSKKLNNEILSSQKLAYNSSQRSNSKALKDSVYRRLTGTAKISVNYNTNTPKWMNSLSSKSCRDMATYYAEMAIRQKKNGHKLYKGGQTFNYQQLAERAMQYANAAVNKDVAKARRQKSKSRAPQYIPQNTPSLPRQAVPSVSNGKVRNKTRINTSQSKLHNTKNSYQGSKENSYLESYPVNDAKQNTNENSSTRQSVQNSDNENSVNNNINSNNQGFTYGSTKEPIMQPTSYSEGTTGNGQNPFAYLDNSSGWSKYLKDLNMGGYSDIFHNMGYVIAMLPDLLVSIFTGQNHISIKNNLLPLGMILMGLFVNRKQNPLLKLILLGGAGAMLFNKAGHKILNESPSAQLQRQQQPVRHFKTYQDEPLKSRIQNPVIKGNLMLATIDGVPNVISISSMPIEAYNKGLLPLNTLANAVLAKYDEQKQNISNEINIQQQEQEKKVVSLK